MKELAPVLEYMRTSSSYMTTWAMVLAVVSLLAIVSALRHGKSPLARGLPLVLFVPGWLCLAFSLLASVQLGGQFKATTIIPADKIHELASLVSDMYLDQRQMLFYCVVFFVSGLVIYTAASAVASAWSSLRDKRKKTSAKDLHQAAS